MPTRTSKKVPDGKLVRLDLDADDRIRSVTITGDFFVEPPAARRELEAAIEGHPVDVNRERLLNDLEAVEATLLGFSRSDLVDLTLEALS
ncbi:MAG: hypothetical protein ACOCQY_00380 [Halorhabdus sp.]